MKRSSGYKRDVLVQFIVVQIEESQEVNCICLNSVDKLLLLASRPIKVTWILLCFWMGCSFSQKQPATCIDMIKGQLFLHDSDFFTCQLSNTLIIFFTEDQLLDHEEANNGLSDFWLPIKGGPKEKSWNDFESAVKETCSEYLQLGGIALLKFLMYVLMVEYDKREYATVYRHNFIRLSVWFGSPNEGMQGCLKKMLHLMTKSVSVDADGTRTSWFAGYTTEKEAKRLLQSEKSGAFLVRFKCNGQPGFLLTKKSRNGLSIVEYPIEVLGDTGKLSFNDRDFPDLPSLVTELQKSWMTDLQPFYSVEGF